MFRDFYNKKYAKLRSDAEKKLTSGHVDNVAQNDLQGLKHEVAVQQIELEMQHDELLKAHHYLGELRAEAERMRDRYHQLFDLATVGLLVLTEKGIVSECNSAFSRMIGQEQDGLAGRTLAEFVAQADRMNFDVLFRQEINNPTGRRIGFHLTDKKERLVSVTLTVVSLRITSGSEKEYLVTLIEN